MAPAHKSGNHTLHARTGKGPPRTHHAAVREE